MTWTPTANRHPVAAPRTQDYVLPAVIAFVTLLIGLTTAPSGGGYLDQTTWLLDPVTSRLAVVTAAAALTLPTLVAVRRPVLATGLAVLGFVLPVAVIGSWMVAAYVTLLGVTFVAARSSRQIGLLPLAALAVCVVGLIGSGAANVLGSSMNVFDYYDFGRKFFSILGFLAGGLVAYGLGLAAGAVSSAAAERQELATKIDEVDTAAAVTAERARLARDLHDVVAHHVSLIAVRAETAPYTLIDPTPETRAVLDEIAQGARAALDELRTILGVLRRADTDAVERTPQPTLADVQLLVATVTEAGQPVQLYWSADLELVNDTVGLVAYRVVQEALTNARSHAAGRPVQVEVRTVGDALHVRVLNDPPAAAAPPSTTAAEPDVPRRRTGLGLVGLRERVQSVGGQLSTGATLDGGFLVDARFPVGGAA